MKKILMVGPVPPPTGGIASVVEDMIHSELASEFSFELFPRPDFDWVLLEQFRETSQK
jgi:hypothetical protein